MRVLAFVLLLPMLVAAADPRGEPVHYVGGTVNSLADTPHGTLSVTDAEQLRFRAGKRTVEVPYERVNLVEYGQNVSRRYVAAVLVSPLFMLAKSRQHFLTVGYQDEAGRQQAMVFRVGKGDIRAMLVSLEARTGRKVQYQDDEARKRGKG